MRRYLFVAIMFFALGLFFLGWLFVANAQAEPYLWCGATPNATKFEINLDGVLIEQPVSHIASETAWLKYDLVGLSFGDHLVEVRACNQWGCSSWFPLAFTKGMVDVLVNPYIDI